MENQTADEKANSSTKRRKQYSTGAQKRRKYVLEPGLKGFLCSCNFREKDCIRESYNLLNEYADTLYGTEGNKGESLEEVANVEEDIEGLLKEIESLKSNNTKMRRFQVIDSGAKNFLFIRTSLEDPVKLAEMIVGDINTKKKHKTRFLLRLIPVEATCKAYIDDIKKECKTLLEKYFSTDPKSYSIVFNHRNNNSLSKIEVITEIANMVGAMGPKHTVNLKQAEVSIVIEVIRGIALLAVVPNFTKYKKYNLHTVCGDGDGHGCVGSISTAYVKEKEKSPKLQTN